MTQAGLSTLRCFAPCPSGHLTPGMRFAYAHPNPYGLRIPARRYVTLWSVGGMIYAMD